MANLRVGWFAGWKIVLTRCDVFPVRRHRANSTQPLLSRPWFQKPNFEPKYLWKYLSFRRMVYFVRNVSPREFLKKKAVICTLKLRTSMNDVLNAFEMARITKLFA